MKMAGSNSPPPTAWFARWGTRLRHSQRLASRYPPNTARPRPRGRRRSSAEMSVTVKPFSERRGAGAGEHRGEGLVERVAGRPAGFGAQPGAVAHEARHLDRSHERLVDRDAQR